MVRVQSIPFRHVVRHVDSCWNTADRLPTHSLPGFAQIKLFERLTLFVDPSPMKYLQSMFLIFFERQKKGFSVTLNCNEFMFFLACTPSLKVTESSRHGWRMEKCG